MSWRQALPSGKGGAEEGEQYYSRQRDIAIQHTKATLREQKAILERYKDLQSTLAELPMSVTVDSMVPLGRFGMMPGHLVHTNEITVLLGDNYFVKTTAPRAQDIAFRRMQQLEAQITRLEKHLEDLEGREQFQTDFGQTEMSGDDTIFEITELFEGDNPDFSKAPTTAKIVPKTRATMVDSQTPIATTSQTTGSIKEEKPQVLDSTPSTTLHRPSDPRTIRMSVSHSTSHEASPSSPVPTSSTSAAQSAITDRDLQSIPTIQSPADIMKHFAKQLQSTSSPEKPGTTESSLRSTDVEVTTPSTRQSAVPIIAPMTANAPLPAASQTLGSATSASAAVEGATASSMPAKPLSLFQQRRQQARAQQSQQTKQERAHSSQRRAVKGRVLERK
eukprot:m.40294 g.40294  ORF g.40294 m.40294 type:complete len:390 (-) comp10421_c0_seq1:59-1228(-)